MFVGTDIGGTFTDLVGYDAERDRLTFGKRLTTTTDLVEAVLRGLDDVEIDVARVDVLKHGTTQVINALLERRGARTALVATAGFSDVLEIGRAGRPVAFDLGYRRKPPLVERSLRFEVAGRIGADGSELIPLDMDGLERVAAALEQAGVDAVAVAFINAYRNPDHEQRAAARLRARLPKVFVTTGTDLSRQWFEFERMSTAVANAYVGPLSSAYIDRFETRLAEGGFTGQFQIMGSNGGVLSPARARQQPVVLVESGPVGGVIGAAAYASALGLERVIAFDMGGTTAKCALVEGARFDVQQIYHVGSYEYGFPIRAPVVDVIEIGTGGGSIAHLGPGGALRVGPRSAGSEPGPACFGRGGLVPTVTDANLVLGRISANAFLGGTLALDETAARQAIMREIGVPLGYAADAVDAVAAGILALTNAQMADLIKEITIERGRDARSFELFVFGGGGPLHGASLARALGIRTVIVPPEPGNFSALGMLLADARVDEKRSLAFGLDDAALPRIGAAADAMREHVTAALRADFGSAHITIEVTAEMRYRGQRSSIEVAVGGMTDASALRTGFLDAYRRRYGHADELTSINVIGVRVTGFASTAKPDLSRLHRAASAPPQVAGSRAVYAAEIGRRLSTQVINRFALPVGAMIEGPAVIEEFGATCIIGPDDRAEIGPLGELRVSVG